MKNKNILINLLPEILDAHRIGMGYKSIKKSLHDTLGVLVTESQLSLLVSDYRRDKLKLKFRRLKALGATPSELLCDDNLRINSISLDESSEIIFCNHNVEINPVNELTIDRIKSMKNPIDRIYAKWFTRQFAIKDTEIVDKSECTDEELIKIKEIPLIIDDVFDSIFYKKLNRDLTKMLLNK